MKRTRFGQFKRTRFPFRILYRSSRKRKWKVVKDVIFAANKKQAAFKASKHLTGNWIRPERISR